MHRVPGRLLGGLVLASRPRQWLKSALVPAAPAAAGVLFTPSVLVHTGVAVVAFTLAAVGTYLVNDSLDAAADREHPLKCHRPIASGRVPVGTARVAGGVAMAVAVLGGAALAGWRLGAVLAGYLALQVAYSTWLKRVAVVELVVVAAGFLLRPLAGAVAAGVGLSQWFLIVASFGSLFIVAGKRYAEVRSLGDGAGSHRLVLREYSAAYLRQIQQACLAVTLLAYCLWAFERAATGLAGHLPWFELSILPVTVGLLRYALDVERGGGGAPEELITSDATLVISGIAWLVLFTLGVLGV